MLAGYLERDCGFRMLTNDRRALAREEGVDGASESSKRGLPEAGGWRVGSVGSVTENTTVHLELAEASEGRSKTSDDISGKARITTR